MMQSKSEVIPKFGILPRFLLFCIVDVMNY